MFRDQQFRYSHTATGLGSFICQAQAGLESSGIVATEPHTTFSPGIALHNGGVEPAQTIARADRALYQAKRNGRNRIATFVRP